MLFCSLNSALAQDPLIARVQQRLDEQHVKQAKASYNYIATTLVYKLDKQGNIEQADTFRNWQRFVNGAQVTDSLLYSSDPKERDKKGKKESKHSESVAMPKLTDPAMDCAVGPAVDGLAAVSFKPRKPKGGDIAGELSVEPSTGALRKSSFYMPKMKWPVKEFSMRMDWTEVNGVLIPSYIWMQAAWNAIITSGRIRVETTISDIKVD
ncbi:MAG TPA: hypothetical protein VMF29_05755 [Candidatus Edwardsbacteria bacterium]|nr:hypothetical protein [Candidatus Edwardsbacteria bacterium]